VPIGRLQTGLANGPGVRAVRLFSAPRPQLSWASLLRVAPLGVEIGLTVWLAHLCVELLWLGLMPPADVAPMPQAQISGQEPADRSLSPALLQFDPFRRQGAPGAAAQASGRQAAAASEQGVVRPGGQGVLTPEQEAALPETELKLILVGARARAQGGGTAIIKLPTGGQTIYQEGEELQPGVILRAIRPGRVVLEHQGRLEALNFFEDRGVMALRTRPTAEPAAPRPSQSAPAPEPVRRANPAQAAPEPAASARQSRVAEASAGPIRLDWEPEDLLSAVQVRPRQDGGTVTGYYVLPGPNRPLFDQAGFKPGDVIVAVDGVPDLNALPGMLEGLSDQRRLGIVVERRGERRRLEFELEG